MSDPKDIHIRKLNRNLKIALRLMTAFQRDRYDKLKMKFDEAERQKSPGYFLGKLGRPREFRGHVPGNRPSAPQGGTLQRFHDEKA